MLENRRCFDEFPWAVGQVCRRWREAFLAYPQLWTSFYLKYIDSGLGPGGFAEMNRRTTMYIERSGQLPLNIIVCIPSHPKYVPRAAWRSLLSCSNRWKRADLELGSDPDIVNDLLERRGEMSTLESMGLNIGRTISIRKPLDSTFAVAPRLIKLKLRCYGKNSGWVFPWSQLTKLNIEMDDAEFFPSVPLEAVLSQLQNAEELRFTSVRNGLVRRYFHPLDAIRLARVRFLEV